MKTLRFGIIGLGYFGKHYLRLLQEIEGADLVAVASRSADGFEKLAFPENVKKFTDYLGLLADPSIDCVVVATPAVTHFEICQAALSAGKHVLVEKPMVISVKEAEKLKNLVQRANKIFMVGHQYLYNDHIRHLKDELDKKILGRVRCVVAEHLYFGPLRSDVGAFMDAATHELAIIDFLFRSPAVIGVRGKSLAILGHGPDDFAGAEISFADGLLLTLVISRFSPQKTRRMIFAGEEGMAIYDDMETKDRLKFYLQPYPKGERQSLGSSHFFPKDLVAAKIPTVNFREPLRNELEHFVDCIRENKTPITDIVHGVRITTLLSSILQKINATV